VPQGSLTLLQSRILIALAGFEPPWTLTGGGALAGFHTAHRTTRDLDLLWRGQTTVSTFLPDVRRRLDSSGLEARSVQAGSSFIRLSVHDGRDSTVVDLVADPVANITEPVVANVSGHEIGIDSRHEILVNKLVALLGRSELRDLQDVEVLLQTGGDLALAVQDAPRKDGGFSPMTLAWLLRSFSIESLAASAGWDQARILALMEFRDALVLRLIEIARP
jgi:hypothetical protein